MKVAPDQITSAVSLFTVGPDSIRRGATITAPMARRRATKRSRIDRGETDAVRRPKRGAQRTGDSLPPQTRSDAETSTEDARTSFRVRAAQFRSKLAKRRHSDTTALVRADRDR